MYFALILFFKTDKDLIVLTSKDNSTRSTLVILEM